MAKDFKVTVQFDYSTDKDADPDELHDAIRDSLDDVDLEGEYEATVYDDDGNETDDMTTITFNADTVRTIIVEPLKDD
jgi:hypothetical protein